MAMAGEPKQEVEIVDIRKVPSVEPDRLGKFDYLVTYRIDPTHVYVIRIPEEKFNEEALKEAIKKDIEERTRWIGKKIAL